MAIEIQCPSCGQTIRVPGSFAGLAGKCKGCGVVLKLPSRDVLSVGDSESPVSSSLGRGMKVFIAVSLLIVLVLASVVPLKLASSWYRERRDTERLANAKELYDRAIASDAAGEYGQARKLLQDANVMASRVEGDRKNGLLVEIAKVRAPIDYRASKQELARKEEERVQREEAYFAAAEERRKQAARVQQEAARAQAQKMYPEYKTSAADLADYLLRLVSSTESSLSYQQHTELNQELRFKFNKFDLRCSEEERKYASYKELRESVDAFGNAQTAWREKMSATGKAKKDAFDDTLQFEWAAAHFHYKKAMSALGEGK